MAKKGKINLNKMEEKMEIPAGIDVSIEGQIVTLKKDSKETKRILNRELTALMESNILVLVTNDNKKEQRRNLRTLIAHIKNDIEGLTNGFEYELEVCNVHFPMNVTFDKAKKEIIIKNLIGEKHPRLVEIPAEVEVEIKMPHIKLRAHNIEIVGQTAADLEKATRIRYKDRNKFQDGIFIIKKPGKTYI
jgi:large subunit ribosomal protein L6